MVSSRVTLQLLLALGAAVAAPAYGEREGTYSARGLSSLDCPAKRSIMPKYQYSRGFEGDFHLSARDLSYLNTRMDREDTPSPPPMSATNAEKLRWHQDRLPASKEAVDRAQKHHDKVHSDATSSEKDKRLAKSNLHTAKEALAGHQDDIEDYQRLINEGNP
jgi:hypothetical protein